MKKLFVEVKEVCEVCDKEFVHTVASEKVTTGKHTHTCQKCWDEALKIMGDLK